MSSNQSRSWSIPIQTSGSWRDAWPPLWVPPPRQEQVSIARPSWRRSGISITDKMLYGEGLVNCGNTKFVAVYTRQIRYHHLEQTNTSTLNYTWHCVVLVHNRRLITRRYWFRICSIAARIDGGLPYLYNHLPWKSQLALLQVTTWETRYIYLPLH